MALRQENSIAMPVNLPIILVSASDLTNASNLISEIIDNEVTDGEELRYGSRVWRLANKYYRADVQMCPLADGEPCGLPRDRLEAHIIHIAEAEDGARPELLAERRYAAAGDVRRAAVRLLLVAAERAPDRLEAWARRRGYELVPLREPRRAEPVGVERARAALHAHTWRGLQRLDGAGAAPAEAAVERAEAFAEALAALGSARGAAAELPDAQRRRRAELVMAALCRALDDESPPL